MSRTPDRAARRAALSGSGPTQPSESPARLPGAVARFGLFGEVMYVGLFVTMLSAALVTLPLALALGVRHLRRYLRGESSGLRQIGADLAGTVLPGLAAGAAVLAAALLLTFDLAIARDRVIPGAVAIEMFGWAGVVLLCLTVVTAAGLWSPQAGWRGAWRGCWQRWRDDPAGVLYLMFAIALVPLMAWQLLPLVVPAIGCLVLAVVAVQERLAAVSPP